MSAAPTTGEAEIHGARIHWESRGEGAPVVLIHGFFLDRRCWDAQVEPLAAAGRRVVRYDVRGFGRSSLPSAGYSDVADLVGLLDALKIDRADLVGLSMGGEIAVDLALAHPDRVAGLVAVDSAVRGHAWSDDLVARAAAMDEAGGGGDLETAGALFVDTFVHGRAGAGRADPGFVDRVRAIMDGYDYGHFRDPAVSEDRGDGPEPIGRLDAIAAPTLVVVGERDQPDFIAIADRLATDIAGAKKVVIEGAGHLPNMEQPEAFNRALLEFLAAR